MPTQSNPNNKRKVLFILSVDTEEEFDWNGDFPQNTCNVENVQQIPKFQAFCESLGVRPTYLVDYPVANDIKAANILKNIAQTKNAEIGAHLHPWCNPPMEGANGERESHVVNLAPNLVRAKLQSLTSTIKRNIEVTPTVFRTGRWGTNEAVINITRGEGYDIDSSVYPYYINEDFSCENTPDKPYWPNLSSPNLAGPKCDIFELPITAGFNRSNFPFWDKVHRLLSSKFMDPLRLIGFAWKTNILRKIYLCPELSTTDDMIALTEAALTSENPVIHMYIHSSSLLPGRNEYTQNNGDEKRFYTSIADVVEHLANQNDVTFCTITEARDLLLEGFAGYTAPQID
ncbi:MAG: WalW protein [Moraxellaceae bacterium]|nr:MAG: WalW protein [Moraxellaceae bacterium]